MEWLQMRGQSASGWLQWLPMLITGLLVSFFGAAYLTSTPVFAADAVWDGQNLTYDGNTYTKLEDQTKKQALGQAASDLTYQYIKQTTGAPDEILIISFPNGADPATTNTAQLTPYTVAANGSYQPRAPTTITVSQTSANVQSGQECAIERIGYMVCGPSTVLAGGMDWIYDQISTLIATPALESNPQNSGVYIAWEIMRNIANVVFIILFLVIIYSQITSFGISNYGIKKLAPRLIIAAILVNASFIICAFMIDLSNILGVAVQDMFNGIRNQVMATGSNGGGSGLVMPNWGDVTAFILSAGAVGMGIKLAGAATAGVASSALVALIPMLVGFALTLVVVFIILAARQALIIILTIISPLAFVFYLLPGTEKWFEKWRSTFFTLLIFFPAFSVIFGGSQLAGMLIIQNANSILMLLLGLGVQVAPLAIAPLVFKLGGGVLNRFAGIMNDKNKGFLDRTKNWASEQSKYLANKRSLGLTPDQIKKRHLLRRFGRWSNHSQRERQERIENYQNKADAAYEATKRHANQDQFKREVEQSKEIIQKELDVKWNTHLEVDSKALEKDLKLRISTDEAQLGTSRLDNRYAELKGGANPTRFIGPLEAGDPMSQALTRAQDVTQSLAVEGLRKSNADRALNGQLAEAMLASRDLQEQAGSIYEFGADSALASAINTVRSDYGKSVEEGRQIVKHFDLSAEKRQKHAMGETVIATDSAGNQKTFDTLNTFTREASIEDQIAVGTVEQVREIVAASGSTLVEYKGTISEALAKSGVKGKAPYMGGKLIDDVYKGEITSDGDLVKYVQEWLAGGKFKPEDIAITDPQGLGLLMEAANQSPIVIQRVGEDATSFATRRSAYAAKLVSGKAALVAQATRVRTEKELSMRVSEAADPLLEKISRGIFTP